jgi:hypothetical protein
LQRVTFCQRAALVAATNQREFRTPKTIIVKTILHLNLYREFFAAIAAKTVIFLCLVSVASALASEDWSGKLGDGTRISARDLRTILENHQKWVDSEFKEGVRANLTNAQLSNVNLENVDLSFADISGAILTNANLCGAQFSYADMTGVNLSYARASNASLFGATLLNANMSHATLDGSLFESATLDNVNFGSASLIRVLFIGSTMKNADFTWTSVQNAVFQTAPGSLPDITTLWQSRGLDELESYTSPHALIELREAFSKAGMREQEREVNYSLMHERRLKAGWFEKIGLMLIEVPCSYGLSPGRPVLILFGLVLVFAVPYWIALQPARKAGIWKIWPKDRLPNHDKKDVDAQLTAFGFRRILIAAYFSLLSAFNVGWKEVNVGIWITRIQTKEYSLKGTGWVRTVTGIQSLISVYMVALWALSYFGHFRLM